MVTTILIVLAAALFLLLLKSKLDFRFSDHWPLNRGPAGLDENEREERIRELASRSNRSWLQGQLPAGQKTGTNEELARRIAERNGDDWLTENSVSPAPTTVDDRDARIEGQLARRRGESPDTQTAPRDKRNVPWTAVAIIVAALILAATGGLGAWYVGGKLGYLGDNSKLANSAERQANASEELNSIMKDIRYYQYYMMTYQERMAKSLEGIDKDTDNLAYLSYLEDIAECLCGGNRICEQLVVEDICETCETVIIPGQPIIVRPPAPPVCCTPPPPPGCPPVCPQPPDEQKIEGDEQLNNQGAPDTEAPGNTTTPDQPYIPADPNPSSGGWTTTGGGSTPVTTTGSPGATSPSSTSSGSGTSSGTTSFPGGAPGVEANPNTPG